MWFSNIFNFFKSFNLFLAVLCLCCCAWASHQGGFSCCRAQALGIKAPQLWHWGLVASQHVESSQIRDWTRVPFIGRQILIHCTTREVPQIFLHGLTLLSGEGNGTPLQYSCLESPMDGGARWAVVHGVAKSRAQLSDFTFTFHFHALEKEMATHSSVLAWRIPGIGEPGRLPSMESHIVGHNWSDLAAAAATLLSNNAFHRIIESRYIWGSALCCG